MNDFGKKIIKWGLILFVVAMVGMGGEYYINVFRQNKMARKVNKAVAECNFVKAHDYLGELAVRAQVRASSGYPEAISEYYATVQKVYAAEIRYLVSQNTEASWDRAYMLPKEVDKSDLSECKKLQQTLYDELLDYANEFEREDIADRITKVKNREESTEEGN